MGSYPSKPENEEHNEQNSGDKARTCFNVSSTINNAFEVILSLFRRVKPVTIATIIRELSVSRSHARTAATLATLFETYDIAWHGIHPEWLAILQGFMGLFVGGHLKFPKDLSAFMNLFINTDKLKPQADDKDLSHTIDTEFLNAYVESSKTISPQTLGWISLSILISVVVAGSAVLTKFCGKGFISFIVVATSLCKALTSFSQAESVTARLVAMFLSKVCGVQIEDPISEEKSNFLREIAKYCDVIEEIGSAFKADMTEYLEHPERFRSILDQTSSFDSRFSRIAVGGRFPEAGPYMTRMYRARKSLLELMNGVDESLAIKQIPATVWFYGPSGVGKSHAITDCINALREIEIAENNRAMSVFTINPGLDYWNNYNGQLAVKFDDFNAAYEDKDSHWLQQIFTEASFNVPMASVETKSRMFTSKYCFIASNVSHVIDSKVLKHPDILDRRRHLLVEVTDTKFHPGGANKHRNKKGWHPTFTLHNPIPDSKGKFHKTKVIGFDELVRQIYLIQQRTANEHLDRAVDAAKSLTERLSNNLGLSYCTRSGFVNMEGANNYMKGDPGYIRTTTPSDGHCFLHAVARATNLRYKDVVHALKAYNDWDRFKDIFPKAEEDVKRYLASSSAWTSDVMDTVVGITPHALKITLNVIDYDNKAVHPHNPGLNSEATVVLERGHYEALLTTSLQAQTIPPLQDFTLSSAKTVALIGAGGTGKTYAMKEAGFVLLSQIDDFDKVGEYNKVCLNDITSSFDKFERAVSIVIDHYDDPLCDRLAFTANPEAFDQFMSRTGRGNEFTRRLERYDFWFRRSMLFHYGPEDTQALDRPISQMVGITQHSTGKQVSHVDLRTYLEKVKFTKQKNMMFKGLIRGNFDSIDARLNFRHVALKDILEGHVGFGIIQKTIAESGALTLKDMLPLRHILPQLNAKEFLKNADPDDMFAAFNNLQIKAEIPTTAIDYADYTVVLTNTKDNRVVAVELGQPSYVYENKWFYYVSADGHREQVSETINDFLSNLKGYSRAPDDMPIEPIMSVTWKKSISLMIATIGNGIQIATGFLLVAAASRKEDHEQRVAVINDEECDRILSSFDIFPETWADDMDKIAGPITLSDAGENPVKRKLYAGLLSLRSERSKIDPYENKTFQKTNLMDRETLSRSVDIATLLDSGTSKELSDEITKCVGEGCVIEDRKSSQGNPQRSTHRPPSVVEKLVTKHVQNENQDYIQRPRGTAGVTLENQDLVQRSRNDQGVVLENQDYVQRPQRTQGVVLENQDYVQRPQNRSPVILENDATERVPNPTEVVLEALEDIKIIGSETRKDIGNIAQSFAEAMGSTSLKGEACSDPGLRPVMTVVLNNTCVVNGGACNGLMLKGDIGVTVAHVATWEKPGQELSVTYKDKTYTAIVLRIVTGKDLLVFRLKDMRTHEHARDITRHLARKGVMKQAEYIDGVVTVNLGDAKYMAHNISLKQHYTAAYDGKSVQGLQYRPKTTHLSSADMLTQKGDCGGVVFANNPRISSKVLGIHSAANAHIGVVTRILYEDIFAGADGTNVYVDPNYQPLEKQAKEDRLPTTVNVYPPDQVLFTSRKVHPHCDFEIVASPCSPDYQPRMIIPMWKTQLRPSPYIVAQDDAELFQPSIMSKFDFRNENHLDPYYISLGKYSDEDQNFDYDELMECARQIGNYCAEKIRKKQSAVRKITVKEAINHVTDMDCSNSLNLDTSPGYPWSTIPGVSGKRTFFEEEVQPNGSMIYKYANNDKGQRLAKDVGRLIDTCTKGLRPFVVFQGACKDEVLPKHKIDKLSTRTFLGAPLHYTIAYRRYCHSVDASLAAVRHEIPIKIGIVPQGLEWNELYHTLTKNGRMGFDLDYSGYDRRYAAEMHDAVGSIYNIIHEQCDPKNTERDNTVRKSLFSCLKKPLVLAGRYIVRLPCGNPSGQPGTSMHNSLANWTMCFYAWRQLCRQNKLKTACMKIQHFMDKVAQSYYGDDVIQLPHPEYHHIWNYDNLSKVLFDCFGMVTTTPAKNASQHKTPLVDISKMTFLKRHFSEVRIASGAIVCVGPLQHSVFRKMLSYTSVQARVSWNAETAKNITYEIETISQLGNSALLEASLWGRKFYTAVANHLNERNKLFGIAIINYDSWDHVFRQVYYDGV